MRSCKSMAMFGWCFRSQTFNSASFKAKLVTMTGLGPRPARDLPRGRRRGRNRRNGQSGRHTVQLAFPLGASGGTTNALTTAVGRKVRVKEF